MSRTYDIVCRDCEAKLWIGQGWPPERVYLYTAAEPHITDLTRFLFKHERHRLEFLDSEELAATTIKQYADESSDAD